MERISGTHRENRGWLIRDQTETGKFKQHPQMSDVEILGS